jgi:hypothetical protein
VPGSWKTHLAVFDAAQANGGRYALVLEGVDHYFGGLICRYEAPGPKRYDRLADANRISTQFLAAYGAGDRHVRRQLNRQVGKGLPVALTRK